MSKATETKKVIKFLTDLSNNADPKWKEQIKGILDYFQWKGVLTPGQRQSLRASAAGAKMQYPEALMEQFKAEAMAGAIEFPEQSEETQVVEELTDEGEPISEFLEEIASALTKLAARIGC